ncbi:MAG: isochorismatase family protein [Phycisphaerae bacterium]
MMHIHSPVLLDLNTQRDLLTPELHPHSTTTDAASGAYPLVHAEKLLDPLKRVFSWAQKLKIPVVSTRLRYLMAPMPGSGPGGSVNPAAPKMQPRLICNPQTSGYQKLPSTLLRKRREMPLDCGTDLPVEGFRSVQQYIFDLPSLNPFECPRLDRLLSESEVGVWVLIGAPLEWTVRTAVLGLLQRRQKVAVVSDAIGQWDPYEGDMALRQIESKNITWYTAAQLVEKLGHPQPIRPTLAALGIPALRTRPNHATTPAPSLVRPARHNSPPARKSAGTRSKQASRQYR